ncbi:hypothetical protein D3C85_1624300 [compost metagenome]
MPSPSIRRWPITRPSGPSTPEKALLRRVSSSRAFGKSASSAEMISSDTVEHETSVKTLPSKLWAAARTLMASAMS